MTVYEIGWLIVLFVLAALVLRAIRLAFQSDARIRELKIELAALRSEVEVLTETSKRKD